MQSIIDTYKKTGTLHHAYLIEGNAELIRPQLFNFLEKEMGEAVKGNPDLWQGRFETLTIDDARMLRERQASRPFYRNVSAKSGKEAGRQEGKTGRKIFIIETMFATVEAQNALLKIFEEPTVGTHFFVITPSAAIFLPTLLSRVIVVRHGGETQIIGKNKHVQGDGTPTGVSAARGLAVDFLAASKTARLALVADIIEEKEKGRAVDFVDELIKVLHLNTSPAKDSSVFKDSAVFSELLHCREYLSDRSASLKLLLEHVALIVPILPA